MRYKKNKFKNSIKVNKPPKEKRLSSKKFSFITENDFLIIHLLEWRKRWRYTDMNKQEFFDYVVTFIENENKNNRFIEYSVLFGNDQIIIDDEFGGD